MTWENMTLGDVSISIQTGPFGSQLHQSDYSESGTPVVMPKDLAGGKIVTDSIARVPAIHVERLCQHKITPNDILYSRRGDVGRCAFATYKEAGWLCGTGCLRVTIDKDKANPKFVFYQLQTSGSIGWVEKHAVGSTMLNLNTSILSHVPLILPNKKIQDKIADILSAYDDLIENNQKQIKLLEEAAQRLYKEWFVDFRFPGHETTPIINGLPEGWEENEIMSLCDKMSAGGTPSRTKLDYWSNSAFLWYKTAELQDCWLIDSEERISIEGLNNSSAKLFPKNTILMAIYASPTLGRLGVLSSEGACNQAALCMLADESRISWQWLYHKLYELRDVFNAVAKGAGQQNISAEVVKRKQVIVPPKELIACFTNIVSPMYERRLFLQKQNRILEQARERLLPKLLSDEIEV